MLVQLPAGAATKLSPPAASESDLARLFEESFSDWQASLLDAPGGTGRRRLRAERRVRLARVPGQSGFRSLHRKGGSLRQLNHASYARIPIIRAQDLLEMRDRGLARTMARRELMTDDPLPADLAKGEHRIKAVTNATSSPAVISIFSISKSAGSSVREKKRSHFLRYAPIPFDCSGGGTSNIKMSAE